MEPTRKQIADLCHDAVHLITHSGLHKGHFIDSDRPDAPAEECALDPVGALRVAACGDPIETDNELANAAVGELSGRVKSRITDSDPVERIAEWADHPERTADDVVEALRAVADELDPVSGDLLEQRHQLDAQDAAYRHIPLDHPELVDAYARAWVVTA